MRNLIWPAALIGFFLVRSELEATSLVLAAACGLGGLALVVFLLVHIAILRALPANIRPQAASAEEVCLPMRTLVEGFVAAGFEPAEQPLRFELTPPVLLQPLTHSERGLYATVFRVEAQEHRIFADVVTLLSAPEASLTTGMDPGAGTLPARSGTVIQIFPKADPAALIERHEEALEWLAEHGINRTEARAELTTSLIVRSLGSARRSFMAHRFINTVRALWRTLSRTNPHMGSIREQKVAERELQFLKKRVRPNTKSFLIGAP